MTDEKKATPEKSQNIRVAKKADSKKPTRSWRGKYEKPVKQA